MSIKKNSKASSGRTMYRGQDIGDRQTLVQICLEVLEGGDPEEIYELLPHMCVIRSGTFLEPLVTLLRKGDRGQKRCAAAALGGLGDARAIEPLHEVFMESSTLRGTGSRSLQASIISAMGEIGDAAALTPLAKILQIPKGKGVGGKRRGRWVLMAVGQLAQQGNMAAVKELVRFMKEADDSMRAQAVVELAVAYWHRPSEVPDTVLHAIGALTSDDSEEVRRLALSSLSDLSELGCEMAGQYL